tara:strand:+ start:116759 stop:116938 length:180 start_codon:yes stop_codon:yes gene_type:complete
VCGVNARRFGAWVKCILQNQSQNLIAKPWRVLRIDPRHFISMNIGHLLTHISALDLECF